MGNRWFPEWHKILTNIQIYVKFRLKNLEMLNQTKQLTAKPARKKTGWVLAVENPLATRVAGVNEIKGQLDFVGRVAGPRSQVDAAVENTGQVNEIRGERTLRQEGQEPNKKNLEKINLFYAEMPFAPQMQYKNDVTLETSTELGEGSPQ